MSQTEIFTVEVPTEEVCRDYVYQMLSVAIEDLDVQRIGASTAATAVWFDAYDLLGDELASWQMNGPSCLEEAIWQAALAARLQWALADVLFEVEEILNEVYPAPKVPETAGAT